LPMRVEFNLRYFLILFRPLEKTDRYDQLISLARELKFSFDYLCTWKQAGRAPARPRFPFRLWASPIS
jgi:hypothetical protein